jgi:maltoporin
VGDLTTHGYFRGGFGANVGQKGRQTCFALSTISGSLLSKYRLGNECEQWAELLFSTVMYVGDDGTVGTFHFMPVAFIPTTYIGYSPAMTTSSQDQQGLGSTGATVAFPNIYADIKGISWLFGGTAWAGSRYYKRESVYISDFFYWNPSGVGAGIEDLGLGKVGDSAPDSVRDLTISYGAFAVDAQPGGENVYLPGRYGLGIRNDLQLRGFRPYPSGELQVGFQYIANWSSGKDDSGDKATSYGGWGVTVQHVQDVLNGTNKLVFQYGRGGGTGFGTLARFYYPDFSLRQDLAESRFRILDVLTIQPVDWFGAQAVVVYQRDDKGTGVSGAVDEWYSAGYRVSFGLTRHLKLLNESGYDTEFKSNGAPKLWLFKSTGAIAITSAKGFWARPELRVYVTYAKWSEAAGRAGIDSGNLYKDPNGYNNYLDAYIAGVQAETMW